MRLVKWCFLIVVTMFCLRCSGPKVIAFTGANPSFKSYYTYRIKHPGSAKQDDPNAQLFYEKVGNAIDDQMKARGYESVDVADIVITYNLILDNEVDYRTSRTSPYSYPYGYNQYSYPYWLERDEYTKGILLVELREDLTRKLIWQASLDLKYNQRSSSKKKISPIQNAFQSIFSEYPYQAGSDKIQVLENK